MKKIMKILSTVTVSSLVAVAMNGSVTLANGNINTSLVRDQGAGAAPIIKAKWEMNGPYASLLGTDDSSDAGAQFSPPGVWNAKKKISFCAVVTDPDGMPDINAVYADFYYPEDTAFHPMDPLHPDQIDGGNPTPPDYGVNGCGAQVGDEIKMSKLSKTDGLGLFCNKIRNSNNNLPTFNTGYDYDEICAPDGELQKETANVYCGDREITWEDPAGNYDVDVFALDNFGVFSDILDNQFEYLPLTSFEVDFSNVNYGNVKLNSHKKISGDLNFGTASLPTVRNLGNTRLEMSVLQDDMGLGTTDGSYNVAYDARVGNNEADWADYDPNTTTWLQDLLDLSETEEMDFSILVKKFPKPDQSYTGNMTLGAQQAAFRQCYE